MANQHTAAVIPSKGAALEVVSRPTPSPGPDEYLIEVKSVALNPIDVAQRDRGLFLNAYPAVTSSDVAGIIISAGSDVSPDAPQPGDRVSAFATAFFKQGDPSYGALQERALVSASFVTPLPEAFSFNEGSLFPMAVGTAWAGFYQLGVPIDLAYTVPANTGILVWGAGSSVGSITVQIAKLLGFKVYATASAKHHTYIKELGAGHMFDYSDLDVVKKIVEAVKADNVTLNVAYIAAGTGLQSGLEILKEFKGEGNSKLVSAPLLPADAPKVDGVDAQFVQPPSDHQVGAKLYHFIFRIWLKEKLEKGEIVASPKVKVIEGGLNSAQKALDELKAGVSGVKLVLEV